MIPEAAVEAAHAAVYGPNAVQFSRQTWLYDALEAAAPHMLAEAWEAGLAAAILDQYHAPNPYKATK